MDNAAQFLSCFARLIGAMLNYSTEAVLQGADLTEARQYLYRAYENVTVAADLQDLVSTTNACMCTLMSYRL